MSALSRISSTCPNIETWYGLARNSSSYGQTLYSDASSISELGSIMGSYFSIKKIIKFHIHLILFNFIQIAGISVSDLSQVSADSISSLGNNVWAVMSPSTVNTLSTSQLEGLTSTQVNGILTSPNYASFSSTIQAYAQAASDPTKSTSSNVQTNTSESSAGVILKWNGTQLIMGLCILTGALFISS